MQPTAAALSLAAALLAQEPPAPQRQDSARTLRAARSAQARFETTRRLNLPTTAGRASGPCHEYIGRFCYWHDEDDGQPPPKPPAEPERIGRARERLLVTLDSAATILPGDEWIAGQRVHYLLGGDRGREALTAARACRATAWWCAALTGLALHAAGDYAAADSAFARALDDMPREERCRWTDLSLLLAGELERRYKRLGCDERIALGERLWWLAQPLYFLAGNDRRTEHYARATQARIAADARSPYNLRWGDDLREITLRYGWPAYWTRQPATPGSTAEPGVTGHEPRPTFHFFPDDADSGAVWSIAAARPRERYAPAYATTFVPLAHQIAVFRRGDSCTVVAAYDVSRDTAFARSPVAAALVVARDERSALLIERTIGPTGQMVAVVPCEREIVSLELLGLEQRRAARARYLANPPDLSAALLFSPSDPLPDDLSEILPHVHGSMSLRPETRIGLYWETYGLAPGETVSIAVTVTPARAGWLRRASWALGLARTRTFKRIEWQERVRAEDGRAARAARALALDLAGLAPGRYRIEVAVAGRSRAVATREVTIEND